VEEEGEGEGEVLAMMDAWQRRTDKNAQTLQSLASQYGCLNGKWLIYRRRDLVDGAWNIIARAVYSGLLSCTSVKVATSASDPFNPSGQHVICCYTKDFRDVADLKRVREELRQIGFKGKIGYKADCYTYCDIYAKNPCGIRPTILYE